MSSYAEIDDGGSSGVGAGQPEGGVVVAADRLLVCVVCLFVFGCFALSATTRAEATTTHEFLSPISGVLAEGVPQEAAPTPGPLSGVNALSVDSGQLWAAEHVEPSGSRVDAFDASTGSFLRQLNEEEGVAFLQTGVAVGHSGGEERVYVGAGQEGKGVVAVFDPSSGKLVHVWTGAGTVNKSFTQDSEGNQVGVLTGIALDSSANPETTGDVYVSTFGVPSFNVINVLKPAAGGSEPAKATTQLVGTCATNQTSCPEEESFKEPSGVAVSGANGDVLVTDSSKIIDVFEPTLLGEYKFLRAMTGTPTGPGASEVPFGRIVSVAVDGKTGDIYVVDSELHVVDQFDAEGKYLGHLTGTPEGPFGSLQSVAVDPADGHVFIGDFDPVQKTSAIDVFGENLVLPDLSTTPATAVQINGEGKVEATLNGTVNPLNEGEVKCHFALGSTAAFGQTIACQPEGVPDGNSPTPVKAAIDKAHTPSVELATDTTYTFRLQASNKNGINPGEASDDKEFHTPGPGIHSTSASDVTATSATLNAAIDPNGKATSSYFQYGKSTAYETAVPAPPGEALGSGSGDVLVSPRHIQGLDPSTVYHYRVVAVAEVEVQGSPKTLSFAGPDQTFTTQGAGGLTLPDGRQWELVSPADKHGALLLPISEVGVIQAGAAGGAISYVASLPTEEHVKGYVVGGAQVISARGPEGWSSQNVSLPHVTPTGTPTGLGYEYRFFSADLSAAAVEPLGDFSSLAPESSPPDSEGTAYVRHNSTCTTTPSTCFEPLLTSAPGHENVPPGTKFGSPVGSLELSSLANFVGATSDLGHVIVSSSVALTATPISRPQLYEWSAGQTGEELQLISALPGGESASATAQLGEQNRVARHAIAEDGSRVVWSEAGGGLYLRDTSKGQTVQLDAPEAQCLAKGKCGGGISAPNFQIASADDSRIFFTDTRQLTANAAKTPGKADLYECQIEEVAGKLQCRLSDLTPSPGPSKAADVQGAVLGASEDGAWVYFAVNGVLGDGAQRGAVQGDCKLQSTAGPGEGECNLYVHHGEATQLIAVVAGEDYPDWMAPGPELSALTARVSPNGQHLAFMSNRSLTGYDNHDALSGKADEEVFVYDAEAKTLACASCDPSGARPRGVEYAKVVAPQLVGGDRVWNPETWLAANIPGFTPYRGGFALYQSRYLSNSGRLFFNANDALLPQDINNDQDVYEFQPAGVGSCTSSSPGFAAASGGCVALISSGRAAGESAFLDASENGDDVFFLTFERLVAKDFDTALDVYDAHVCSQSAQCFSESASPPPCITADACRVAPSPQPNIFGSPSSATFSGQGNLPPASPAVPKKLTKAQQLAKALAACAKKYKKQKKRRASCKAQAHKRYGAKQAKKPKPKAKRK